MGILKRAADLAYTLRFLTLLVTPWEKSEAFKLGLIDGSGKRLKKASSSEEKNAMTAFHKLVYNVKRLIPGGKLGSYASALYLIKEGYAVKEAALLNVLKRKGVDTTDLIHESAQWYILEGDVLSPQSYKLTHDRLDLDEVYEGDWVHVKMDNKPVGNFMGINIYEVEHIRTKQKVHVSTHEISI